MIKYLLGVYCGIEFVFIFLSLELTRVLFILNFCFGTLIGIRLHYKIKNDIIVLFLIFVSQVVIFFITISIVDKYMIISCMSIFLEIMCFIFYKFKNNKVIPENNVNCYETFNMNVCSICLEYYVGKNIIRILSCGHCYHKFCIDKWKENKNTCPVCNV